MGILDDFIIDSFVYHDDANDPYQVKMSEKTANLGGFPKASVYPISLPEWGNGTQKMRSVRVTALSTFITRGGTSILRKLYREIPIANRTNSLYTFNQLAIQIDGIEWRVVSRTGEISDFANPLMFFQA